MKTRILLLAAMALFGLAGCKKSSSPANEPEKPISVLWNDVPFKTDKYLRIPYTLKTWEFEKDGLKLRSLTILDNQTRAVLVKMDSAYYDLPATYKDSVQSTGGRIVKISGYYISIQLPIALTQVPPSKVTHRFEFKDTIHNKTVVYDGPAFTPRLNETPLAVSPPVKGENWSFTSLSSNAYHFNGLYSHNGKLISPQRFGWDNSQSNQDFVTHTGDPKKNSSYFCYRDTLYAVLAGKVVSIQDGYPENSGDAHDAPLTTIYSYDGNFLELDIGGGFFAYYCHCVPNSFLVKPGDYVAEGAPLALLGNSGNSTQPHLHFQVTDGPDIWNSTGVPVVLKQYVKTAVYWPPWAFITPETFNNALMEVNYLVKVE